MSQVMPAGAPTLGERMLHIFRQESNQGLDQIAQWLTTRPEDPAAVAAIFRILHTLQGSAAMNGLDLVARLAGALEARFEWLRRQGWALDAETAALTAAAIGLLRPLLEAPAAADLAVSAEMAVWLERLHGLTGAAAAPPATGRPAQLPEVASAQSLFQLVFEPGEGLLRRGVDVLALFAELAALGELEPTPSFDRLPTLAASVPDSSYLGWQMRLLTRASLEEVEDVFMFVLADSRVQVQVLPMTVP